MKKVFISHSHQDSKFAEIIVKILEKINVPSKNIFCSSLEGYGVPLGDDFLERIKSWLSEETIVILILSENFYKSPVSLCEMGATWVKAHKTFPIIIPPFTFEEIKGTFPTTLAFEINNKYKLTELKEQIELLLTVPNKTPTVQWEYFKDRILEELETLIESRGRKNATTARLKSIPKDSLVPTFTKIEPYHALINNIRTEQQSIQQPSSFSISKTAVTKRLFHNTMGNQINYDPKEEDHPITNITWITAVEFCNKLSESHGLTRPYHRRENRIHYSPDSTGYRLPTEIEWEIACASGLHQNSTPLGELAWYSINSGNTSRPVGTKKPDQMGNYDMLGNIWEWCFSDYKIDAKEPSQEKTTLSLESNKVVKGGSYLSTTNLLNPQQRTKRSCDYTSEDLGFRIIKN